MSSVQVSTTNLIRQFATTLGNGLIEVTTKLGPSTVGRASFHEVEFPSDEVAQARFLRDLMDRNCPGAYGILRDSAEKCFIDQAVAVTKAIAE